MIKDLISRIKVKCSSLYVGLFLNIFLGILLGVTVYALTQLVSDSYIRLNYASEDRRDERESEQIAELRKFVKENELYREDVIKVAEWATDQSCFYLMLYDGDRLIYTSDLGVIPTEGAIPESSNTVVNSGLTVDHPTNATLREYASQNGRVEIKLFDCTLYASVYDYSEYLSYDVVNILSMVFAFVSLAFIIINYFRRIVKRVRRLEADVTIVTHSSMEHKIATRGSDEIGRLSANIENMRQAILDNLQREREARDSNTELITAMSHDIRTPLTVLLGYLEMMKGEADGSPVMREHVDASERTALRLKQLSDDMFKYSLAFGDSIEGIDMQQYDAGLLFEQMLSEHVLLLRENDYTVEVNNALGELPAGAVVTTDAQNLMRIIDNVFSNVRKYADPSKPVTINARRLDERRIVFECINTVRTDTYKAESNKIGLKTCERLAGIIADGFEFGLEGELFACRLVMHVELPEDNTSEGDEKLPEKKGGAIEGFVSHIVDFVKSLFGKGEKHESGEGKREPRREVKVKPVATAQARVETVQAASHPHTETVRTAGAHSAHIAEHTHADGAVLASAQNTESLSSETVQSSESSAYAEVCEVCGEDLTIGAENCENAIEAMEDIPQAIDITAIDGENEAGEVSEDTEPQLQEVK